MKPKTSPTSPKAKTEEKNDIEALYKESLNTIDKPVAKARFSVGWIVLIVVIGFISGIVGLLALLSFGDRIPFLEQFGISSGSDNTSVILTTRDKNQVLTAEQTESIARDVSPTIISISRAHSDAEGLVAQYPPDEAVADGFILTNDGYAVTLSAALSDDETYVAVAHDGSVYAVTGLMHDPASPYTFLQLDVQNQDLESLGFSDVTMLYDTEEVIAVKPTAISGQPRVLTTTIVSSQFHATQEAGDYRLSSDTYPYSLLLGAAPSDHWAGSVVFTLDQKALGIIEVQNDQYVLAPFSELSPILENVLAGSGVTRPYLGVQYVLLDTLTTQLNADQALPEAGAYLYDDGDINPVGVDSPAAAAELQAGDIITAVDDQEISRTNTLSGIILAHRPDDTVDLTVERDGVEETISVTLETQ